MTTQWAYDIEVFPNFFSVIFFDVNSETSPEDVSKNWGLEHPHVHKFVYATKFGFNDIEALRDFLRDDIKTLGLKLVKLLTAQLNGTISYKKDKGSVFIIVFSVAYYSHIDIYNRQDDAETKKVGKAIIAGAAGAAGTILQFVLSIIISGILVANASGAYDITVKIFTRLTSAEAGMSFANLSRDTIRSVAQGVLGVAMIQAVLSALGMMVMDVPAWGLWTLAVLVVAIAQIPPIVILGFVSAYVFSVAETTPAVIFLIYCIVVSSSDAFLKPLFERLRPCKVMDVHLLVGCGAGYSFPSSHAANIFGQALFFGLLYRPIFKYLILFIGK